MTQNDLTRDEVDYTQWIGRSKHMTDVLYPGPLQAMAAVLDKHTEPDNATDNGAPDKQSSNQNTLDTRPGSLLPPLWHWLYFLSSIPQAELDQDGHARRGGFLPPVSLPQRMWASGKIEFLAPLRIGQSVTRQSTIRHVTRKQGRSGPLVFVEIEHCYSTQVDGKARHCLLELQTLVYREAPHAGDPGVRGEPVSSQAAFSRQIAPQVSWLFRYSALTFNAHRIHYDRDYATRVEHYPGLVVHAPLVATLLVDLFCSQYPGHTLREFEFRARAPLFDLQPFTVCGEALDDQGICRLWAENADQQLCMSARARVA